MSGTNDVDALLDRFPGPLRIGVSIPKYLVLVAGAGVFCAAGIALICHPETFAARLASHSVVRGGGLLHLLVLLRVARDMSQALAELGWSALIFFGIAAFLIAARLMLSAAGLWGLVLDSEGFIVLALKHNKHHRWQDVGDFDTLEVPWIIRRRIGMPLSKSCLVFNDYQAPESPIKWLQRSGCNRALAESYEYSAKDLAMAMSVWRERALKSRASQFR